MKPTEKLRLTRLLTQAQMNAKFHQRRLDEEHEKIKVITEALKEKVQ